MSFGGLVGAVLGFPARSPTYFTSNHKFCADGYVLIIPLGQFRERSLLRTTKIDAAPGRELRW